MRKEKYREQFFDLYRPILPSLSTLISSIYLYFIHSQAPKAQIKTDYLHDESEAHFTFRSLRCKGM